MSTLSEDLDYYDSTLYDPMNQPQDKSLTHLSVHMELKGETNESSDEDDEEEYTDYGPCGTKMTGSEEEWGGEGEVKCDERPLPENGSEKDKESSDQFNLTELWSDKESTVARSIDSWDLPVGPVAWDDNDKPIERLLNYADLTLTEEEENGLLTDRIVAACSSYLTESPGNKCHVVAKVCLNNKNLNDIRILGYHRFLQYVDLSWNNLTDLTPLGCIPYLMYLDVSHNLIEEVLRFTPPLNLTYVNYSYNEVWQIDDLTDFWALCYLDLSHNKISKIQGLHNLRYLRHLDLSYNKIERLENLNNLRITDLNLEFNLISKFETELGMGMKTMPYLTNLYLNNNLIKSLAFLQEAHHLKKLELQGNSISDLIELSHLKPLKNLRQLDLSGNPVSELKPYRNLILNFLQELRFLDQTEVDISERVAACKKHRFDVQLEAARNNARMILLEQLNNVSLDLDVLPVDQGPYPFVILVGPSASSKKYIIARLAEKYPDRIYIGKLHTTREVLESEETVLVHMTREDFNEDIKSGKFLCVTENLGQLYGFSREELGNAIKEHKLCLTAMDMIGALTIHSYGIQPFMILTILKSKEEHIERLKVTYGPVLSSFGAAYIAQRQLINTHASNIKRVETILNDIINEAIEKVDTRRLYVYPESVGSGFVDSCTSESVDKFTIPIWGPSAEEQADSYTESTGDIICYPTSKNCYACTPSKCGFQTAHLKYDTQKANNNYGEDDEVSLQSDIRLSASESETKGGASVSSYSVLEPPPMKTEHLSQEDFLGESDTFAHWSMPFIDWSEVNLDELQLEEAAEVLCQKYIENVMSSRDVYQNLHLDNPGLFSLCVFTDDIDQASKEITKYLKEVWRSTPNRKPSFDLTNDLVHETYVPKKLDQLKEMLRNDFVSADGDGCLKNFSDVAPINSPASICAEMRGKGYGDSSENP